MSSKHETNEAVTMQSLVHEFCKTWCDKEEELDDMKSETINLLAELQKQFTISTIRNEDIVGENLYTEVETIMNEFNELKEQIKFMRTSEEAFKLTMEKSNQELREQLEKSKSTRTKANYGAFSSKVAKEFADENGIKEEDITGTGKDNKITKKDIQKHLTGAKPKKKGKKTTVDQLKKKTKKKCNGAKGTGSPCKNSGSLLIKGKWYCKKHESQAVQEDLKEEAEEEYSDYDESNDELIDTDPLTRFRKESLKSVENMDEDDKVLNDMIDGYDSESDTESTGACGKSYDDDE